MLELILFRALQGLGAGGLIVTAMAVIADLVPPRERARYMGMIGGVFAVASVAGPLLGGFFVDQLSWRWVFYVNLPVGAAALAVIAAKLPASPRRERRPVDVAGRGAAHRGRGEHDRAGHLLGRHRVRVGLPHDRRPGRHRLSRPRSAAFVAQSGARPTRSSRSSCSPTGRSRRRA